MEANFRAKAFCLENSVEPALALVMLHGCRQLRPRGRSHEMACGQIRAEAAANTNLQWAFGTLIGNTNMHGGNQSFIAEPGRPYDYGPAYDMTPMAFAPRSGGGLPDSLKEATIHPGVDNSTWHGQMRWPEGFSPEPSQQQHSASASGPASLCLNSTSTRQAPGLNGWGKSACWQSF